MSGNLTIIYSTASIALSSGGPSHTVSSLANEQARQANYDVHLVLPDDPAPPKAPTDRRVSIHNVPPKVPRSIFATRALLRQLWSGGRTILHDQGIWHSQNFAAPGFAAKNDLPYVISTHGMLEPWALSYRSFRKRVARRLFQDRLLSGARCLMATSDREAENLRQLGFKNPIAVIPNGIDADIPQLARKTAPSPRTMLFLSRIHPVKGLRHAIEAWQVLRPADWRLKIVGPSEAGHRDELQGLVDRLGLREAITFHDAIDGAEKYQEYYDADAFILPSHSENFGVAVAEALACGLPVVTTVATPWRELPLRGCGWCIEVGTAPLIDALPAIFASTSEELKAIGMRGREWVMRSFQWPAIASQHVAVYEWILGSGERPEFVQA